MGFRALQLSPSPKGFTLNVEISHNLPNYRLNRISRVRASAKKEEPKKNKQSLFSSVTEALDFSQVRSQEDAQLLEDARQATKSGGKMSREQVCVYIVDRKKKQSKICWHLILFFGNSTGFICAVWSSQEENWRDIQGLLQILRRG